jgi:undecaprenyl-diphosphatase
LNSSIQPQNSIRLQRYLDTFAALVFSLIAIAVASQRGLRLDRAIAHWIQGLGQDRPWLQAFMPLVTHLGDTWTILLTTIIFAILLLRITRSRRAPYSMILAHLIAWVGNNLIKVTFARQRPQLSPLYLDPSSYSFPSGHAMISAAVYGTAASLLCDAFPRFKWLIRISTGLLVLLIGTSRVYLDAHWPSDVVGGFAAGWITISIVRIVFPAHSAPR